MYPHSSTSCSVCSFQNLVVHKKLHHLGMYSTFPVSHFPKHHPPHTNPPNPTTTDNINNTYDWLRTQNSLCIHPSTSLLECSFQNLMVHRKHTVLYCTLPFERLCKDKKFRKIEISVSKSLNKLMRILCRVGNVVFWAQNPTYWNCMVWNDQFGISI